VRRLINDLGKDKLVIVSTHILEEVHEVCTRAIIIADGRIVADETRLRSKPAPATTTPSACASKSPRNSMRRAARCPAPRGRRGGIRCARAQAHGGAEAGADTLSAVSAVIVKHDWDVPELHLESGRLDEVFRSLTQPQSIAVSMRKEPARE